jgi:hypothetical protein
LLTLREPKNYLRAQARLTLAIRRVAVEAPICSHTDSQKEQTHLHRLALSPHSSACVEQPRRRVGNFSVSFFLERFLSFSTYPLLSRAFSFFLVTGIALLSATISDFRVAMRARARARCVIYTFPTYIYTYICIYMNNYTYIEYTYNYLCI